MVSVDDMGQGNQSLRILGIRWLPSGAASRTVGPNGKLEKADKNKMGDRTDPEAGQDQDAHDDAPDEKQEDGDEGDEGDGNKSKEEEESEAAMREGMEAEEGDFINLEMAVAYRSRATGKSIRAKAKNAHLFLKFYSIGGVALPVWVEVRGFIATLRLRLQLTVSFVLESGQKVSLMLLYS
jgi:Ca2+-dependent lipid-binding protein